MKWPLVAGLIIVVMAAPMARADDGTNAGSGSTSFWTQRTVSQFDDIKRETRKRTRIRARSGPSIVLGRAACPVAEDFSAVNRSEAGFCSGPPPGPAVITTGLIRRAFAELELPAGRLVIQPPDGLTLVNFDTNFYTTTTDPISRTVTLLGQRVTLEATPATYTWEFGDGAQVRTTDPGAPYPALRITHNYLRKGSYRPSLSTTYTGRYRINGSEWRQIPGTVTIDGTGQPLRAIEAQPKLVGY